MSPIIYALGAVAGLAVIIAVLQLMPQASESLLDRRLGSIAMPPLDAILDADKVELQKSLGERVISPMLQSLGRLIMRGTPASQLDELRTTLMRAGSTQRAETLLAMRAILLPTGALVGVGLVVVLKLTMPLALLGPVLLALLGYMYPVSSIKGRIKKRKRALLLALPGVLDLLTISMEAGLSLDMAISRVADADESILAAEFQKVLNEIRLGRPRSEALLAMAERCDLEELSAFVNAVVQAEPLGVSVAGVLRIQSEELRRLRKQRAEEAGHRAPVLMLLPMMGCIFPCIFICLLGPAALTIINGSH